MPYKTINVEKKHTYKNLATYFEYGFDANECCVVFDPSYPTERGTNSDQFIGDKISLTSIILDATIQHSYNQGAPFAPETFGVGFSYSGTLTNGTGSISVPNTLTSYKPYHDWYSQFRAFLFETETDEVLFDTAAHAKQWFLKNYVPYTYENGGTQAVTNNQIDILRESTVDTGTFKILWDHKFTLTNKKPMKHLKYTFVPKSPIMSYNKETGTVPTNKRYSFVIFGPFNKLNYDYSLYSEFAGTGSIKVNVDAVVKTNYLDA